MNRYSWAKQLYVAAFLCAMTAINSAAQTFTILHVFNGSDGSTPYAGLVQATDGNLYGTTSVGGGYSNAGTVFKMSPSGTLTTLHAFDAGDGSQPEAPVVQAADGSFYGTTYGGWAGFGTVFKIAPTGVLTIVHGFSGYPTDGAHPAAGLIQATDGNLYGTTYAGGTNSNPLCDNGCGTVFKVTPTGTFTTLYDFCSQSNCTDGEFPSGLIQATDGNLYGTTPDGGATGDGSIFKIALNGAQTTLYSFGSQPNGADGFGPVAGLVQASDGNLYGTTDEGGAYGDGTVFRITRGGALTTLHSFHGTDGMWPSVPLIQATDGNLYGTTRSGGSYTNGTIFKISLGGTLTTLHSFDWTYGNGPYGALVQDTAGNFYGTTAFGYGSGSMDGAVYTLSAGLGPFVETQPAFGNAGKLIKILGTNLTGATGVTFNGTPAVFAVLRNSVITATVPVGATTGTVEVVTPSGTLSSNVPFRVAP